MHRPHFLLRRASGERVDITLFMAPSKIFVGHQTSTEGKPADAYVAISYRNRREYRALDAQLIAMGASRALPAIAYHNRHVQVVYTHRGATQGFEQYMQYSPTLKLLIGRLRYVTIVSTAEVRTDKDSYRVFTRCAANHQLVQLRVLGPEAGMRRYWISDIANEFQTFVDPHVH